MHLKNIKTKHRAFTMIELIVVIAILAVIMSAIFAAVRPSDRIQETQQTKSSFETAQFNQAMNIYAADPQNEPITFTEEELAEKNIDLSSSSGSLPICQYGAEEDGCVSLDKLVDEGYISGIPNLHGSADDQTGLFLKYEYIPEERKVRYVQTEIDPNIIGRTRISSSSSSRVSSSSSLHGAASSSSSVFSAHSSSSSSSVSSSSLSSQSSSIEDAEPAYDIALVHESGATIYFPPVETDFLRGDLLRQAISQMGTGDTLLLAAGTFDMDCKNKGNIRFPNKITVVGAGMHETHLYGDCYSDMQSAAFEVRSGSFSDLTFENKSWKIFEDGRTIETYNGMKRTEDNINYLLDENRNKIPEQVNPGPFRMTFDRVKFVGTAWVVYTWNNRNNVWIIRDSEVVSGRQGLSFMSNNGGSHSGYILRTKIYIDTMLSQDIGWTSNKTHGGGYAVVIRGGNVTVEDSEFHMKCGNSPHVSSYIPRCAGIYDGNGFGSQSGPNTWIRLLNNRWYVDGDFYGSRSPDTADIWMSQTGAILKMHIEGGCGSGPDCEIIKDGSHGLFYTP